MLLLLLKFVAFPERKDSIFRSLPAASVGVESNGNLGFYYGGKCHPTYPNSTLTDEEDKEWCSAIAPGNGVFPWISYGVKNKRMRVTGYSVRNGCCKYVECCCYNDSESGMIRDLWCCCAMYSFELQGSNDNVTWKTIHKVEKKKDFYFCKYETYSFEKTEAYSYLRFVQTEEYPGCKFCMVLNQIDFYGEVVDSFGSYDAEFDSEESVSIIGKIKKE